jgi:hypothetical protein
MYCFLDNYFESNTFYGTCWYDSNESRFKIDVQNMKEIFLQSHELLNNKPCIPLCAFKMDNLT